MNCLPPRLGPAEVLAFARPVEFESLDEALRQGWAELCEELGGRLVCWPDGVCGLVSNRPGLPSSMTLQGRYQWGRSLLETGILQWNRTTFVNA